jgi:thioredoxin 1
MRNDLRQVANVRVLALKPNTDIPNRVLGTRRLIMDQTTVHPIAVTDNDFSQEVLNSDKPVLVDFWAAWCAPCRALGPVLESLAEDYGDRAKVAKLDVDANQQVAMKYGIRSIPTVILFDKGEIVDSFIGVRPKAEYVASLEEILS